MRRLIWTLLLAMPLCGAGSQDLQTSNDWATGAAHARVIDSINRENVKRLRAKQEPARSRQKASAVTRRSWTPAERARNCAFVRANLARLNAHQLKAYRTACR